MNGWIKCACLAGTTLLFVDCNAYISTGQNSANFYQIDSMSPTIIRPDQRGEFAILSTDSTSKVLIDESAVLSQLILKEKSETDMFNPENLKFIEIMGLPHVQMKDLKIAVDDYGIINYLNPDF
jgi:hypothetical protein